MVEITKKVDGLFEKVQKYVTVKIGAFVAFVFLVFAAGAYAAIFVATRWPNSEWLIIAGPALAGIIAYYNRGFASVVFVVLVLAIFFL